MTKAQAARQAVCRTPLSLKELVRSPALPTRLSGTLRKMLHPSLPLRECVVLGMKQEYRVHGEMRGVKEKHPALKGPAVQ